MKKRLLFISKGADSPSTRYRALQFFPYWENAGFLPVHVAASGGLSALPNLLRQAARADVVVVIRKTFPAPLLYLLRRASRSLIFDFDDAIFCNTDGTPSPLRGRRFAAMMRVCDHVLAGNAYLASKVSALNKTVTVIPTCLDVSKYDSEAVKPAEATDLVWIGSSSTRKYLVEVLPALRLASARVPGLRLKIIADFDLPDGGIPTLAVPWRADTEASALASSHIGIAPMRDDDWSRGKCALKVLQYMAAGLPVISSDNGANAEIVKEGETGFLVSSPEAWADRIVQLAGDPAACCRMGENGRQFVTTAYSIEAVFSRILPVVARLA